jgi:predicted RNase H-like HicB family nuclease
MTRQPIEGSADTNSSAYVPGLPDCVATGSTRQEAQCEMRDAVAPHLDGLREVREAIPHPSDRTATHVPVHA